MMLVTDVVKVGVRMGVVDVVRMETRGVGVRSVVVYYVVVLQSLVLYCFLGGFSG